MALSVCGLLLIMSAAIAAGQRLALIAPERSTNDRAYASRLNEHLEAPIRVLDDGMADVAFRSVGIRTPFNMTAAEARAAATVVGCEYLLLLRTGEQRRTSFTRPEYYESFAILYLIDGRTGSLISWRRSVFEYASQSEASRAMEASAPSTAASLAREIAGHRAAPDQPLPAIEEVPSEDSPAAKGLRPPIPYRRIKPEYTEIAFLYDVRATIDAEVDIAADGTVLRIRFTRWAGFGLEESVEKAVRTMNWRPAMRNGRPLPMRILLRYNFTKVDKDQTSAPS